MKSKTIREIKTTFFRLLTQKNIDKITVSEICALCEINRGTFYRYYQDVYALLSEIETDFVLDFNNRLREIAKHQNDRLAYLTDFLEMFKTKRKFLFVIFTHGNPREFYNIITQTNAANSDLLFSEMFTAYPADKDFLQSFCAGGVAAVIITWIKNDFAAPTEHIARFIIQLSNTVTNAEYTF